MCDAGNGKASYLILGLDTQVVQTIKLLLEYLNFKSNIQITNGHSGFRA